jgi:hypothetical protein
MQTNKTNKQPDPAKLLEKLFSEGQLVQIHVSKWGMTVPATEKDLGLDKSVKEGEVKNKIPDFISIGKKYLFTDDVRLVFGRIESNARQYLLNNSHRFPMLTDAHFVPRKIVPKITADLDKIGDKYMKEVDIFIENYAKYQEKMFEAYPNYKDILLPFYPSPQEVRPKFGFKVGILEISFPKKLKNVTTSDVIAQNLAVEQATSKYEQFMQDQKQYHLEQMDEFFKESLLAMRGEIVKTFEAIASKIQNREIVSETNLKTMRNTIESFDALDFLNDAKVKANLDIVKKLISPGADFKNSQAAVDRLSAAINTTLTTAKAMTDIDTITGDYKRRLDFDGDI